MITLKVLRKIVLPIIVLIVVAWLGSAAAGSVSLQLVSVTLRNVDDAAGRWQHEGGNILKGTTKVGQYALTRRVTTSGTTAPLNTAMTTITLFFATAAGTAPENVTLQGSHDFTLGNFRGGVSAASNKYSWIKGADASYSVSSGKRYLYIYWTGASLLTLP
jgi:hypothetical protein